MTSEMLLYLMVTDLREFTDDELRDYLELLLGQPDTEPAEALHELRELILDQLEADTLDREKIADWPEEFAEQLLPESMQGYPLAVDRFEELVEGALERLDGEEEEVARLLRFHSCLELLHASTAWRDRSEAARGLATLEEEVLAFRDAYLTAPVKMEECSPASVVAHRQLLEAFEVWQEAFRLVHQGKLEDALDAAGEATGLFIAVESWAQLAAA